MNGIGPVRVIGVGSPLGDDAAGWEAVRWLEREKEWGSEIEFHIVEGGQRLFDKLDGNGVLLLVDAADSPATPGTIRRLEWPDPCIDSLRPGTTHHLRPAEVLQLAAALGFLPPTVVIWTIAGTCFGLQAGLSPPVAAALPQFVQQIVAELETITNTGTYPVEEGQRRFTIDCAIPEIHQPRAQHHGSTRSAFSRRQSDN